MSRHCPKPNYSSV